MEESILDSTKKTLGLSNGYTTFDHDIIMHINSTFSILEQLGIGPVDGFMIEDNTNVWSDYVGDPSVVPAKQLHLIKTYLYLKVRSLFDPPTTSYMIESMSKQIAEYEYRLSTNREIEVQRLLNESEVA